jgi:uncharacterized damage-inducible protein DinB
LIKQGGYIYTIEALVEFHDRTHSSLKKLLEHCRQFSPEELNRELAAFGYPKVRLQLHHGIGAEKYWIGVLQGRMDVDDNVSDFPTVKSLETYRQQVFSTTAEYLHAASAEELNTARSMITWGNKERILTPAHVFIRTQTHFSTITRARSPRCTGYWVNRHLAWTIRMREPYSRKFLLHSWHLG